MVNVSKLREAIKNSNYTIASLSLALGMNDSTFYRKLERNGSTFTLEQADIIKNALGLDAETAQSIFFSSDTHTA